MGENNTIIFGRKEETFFIFGRKKDVGKKRKVIFGRKEYRPSFKKLKLNLWKNQDSSGIV
jgi:hypothetical protein